MFVIDERPFQAKLAEARASLEEAEASLRKARDSKAREVATAQVALDRSMLELAEVEERREQSLFRRNASTSEDAQRKQAIRRRMRPRWTRTGPTWSRPGPTTRPTSSPPRPTSRRRPGSSPRSTWATELAVVRQLDPMGVEIQVASRYLDRVARLIDRGLAIEIFRPGLEGEEARRFPGKATVIDNTINPTTSTFLIRGEIANAAKTLLPGEYVKAHARVGEARDALVAPEEAVVETQAGPAVYAVDEQGKVKVIPVRATFTHEGLRVLESGLQPGQEVIVEGLQLVRSGMTVKTRRASHGTQTESKDAPAAQPGADANGVAKAARPATAPGGPESDQAAGRDGAGASRPVDSDAEP